MATKKSKKKAAKSGRAATKKAASKRAATKKPTAKSRAKKSSAVGVHPVVHWEIQSQMPDRLHKFYAEAFGWKVNANNLLALHGNCGLT